MALDSNILVYEARIARKSADADKIPSINRISRLLHERTQAVVSTQALGETFNVVVKAGLDRETAAKIVGHFSNLFSIVAPSLEDFGNAVELAKTHKLQIWDSLILANASSARCSYLLSEDMQDGFAWRGTTVLNPLTERAEQLLFG